MQIFIKKKSCSSCKISDKVDFSAKKSISNIEGYYDKKVNLPGRFNDFKCGYTYQQSPKTYEAKRNHTENVDKSTIIVRNFKASLSVTDRTCREKTSTAV